MTEHTFTTIHLTFPRMYQKVSVISVLANEPHSFWDQDKSREYFLKLNRELYTPFFNFIWEQKVPINLIITGQFLDYIQECAPKLLLLIQKLIQKQLVRIVADSYYGENLSSLYHQSWWAQSILKTKESIKNILGLDIEDYYLPQIYRNLELERLGVNTKPKHFYTRQRGKKFHQFSLKLSELRKFNKQSVNWIDGANNTLCTFNLIPDPYYFIINAIRFQDDLKLASKTFRMEVGYVQSDYITRIKLKKIKKIKEGIRLSEKPSYGLFNSLERSVIRLWEYSSRLLLTNLDFTTDAGKYKLFEEYFPMFNAEFLLYLNKRNYSAQPSMDFFSSPYEAFATMQAFMKKVEILTSQDFPVQDPEPVASLQ